MPVVTRSQSKKSKKVKMTKGETEYTRMMTRAAAKAIRDAQAAKDAKAKEAAEKEAASLLARLKKGMTGRNAVIAAALIAIVAGGASKAAGYQVVIPDSAVKAFAAFGKTSRNLASSTAAGAVAGAKKVHNHARHHVKRVLASGPAKSAVAAAKKTHQGLKWILGQVVAPNHLRSREAFVNAELSQARLKHAVIVGGGVGYAALATGSALKKHAQRLGKRSVNNAKTNTKTKKP